MTHEICEEHVRIQSPRGGVISGVLSYPEHEAPRAGVLLCSPHPNFAGNMDNNVIVALARRLSLSAVTLRFDYRGVGASTIELTSGESVYDFWNRVEETQEYVAPLEDTHAALSFLGESIGVAPLHVAGYSFGCITGLMQLRSNERVTSGVGIAPPLAKYGFDFLRDASKPCLLLSGTNDFVFTADAWSSLKSFCSPRVQLETFEGHDHFFRGDELMICARTAAFFGLPISTEEEMP